MSRARRVVFIAVAVTLPLTLVEGAVRLRERVLYGSFARAGTTLYTRAPDRGAALAPGAQVSGSRLQVNVNALGFRGRDVAIPKPAGVTRVVCVGGSTTFDVMAASDDETWPARLERRLRERRPNVEVVNAGVCGYTVDEVLARTFWANVARVEPDVVVAYLATNEISRAAQSRRASEPPRVPGLIERAFTVLTDWSLAAYKARLVLDGLTRPPEVEGRGTLPLEDALAFKGRLRELVHRVKSIGARPVIATFALRWKDDQPLETQRRLAAGAFAIYPGLSLAGVNGAFDAFNAAITAVARDERCELVRAREALGGSEELFSDFVHFSPAGSHAMAELVARTIAR